MQKIYIVEDDKNIAEIEEFALKNSGFEVYTFSNAKDFDKKMENKYPIREFIQFCCDSIPHQLITI